jgi:predicted permease
MVLLAVTLGVLVGLLPARTAGRVDVQQALRAGERNAGGATRLRIHTLLATGQVTLAVTLMLCAGLLFRSFWTLRTTNLGFDADRVVAVTLSSIDAEALSPNSAAETDAYGRALAEVQADPRVESAALIIGVPFLQGFSTSISVPGLDSIPALPGGGPWISAVGPDYFRTAGTSLLRGRGIGADDRESRVVVVSTSMADLLWGDRDPIGDCMGIGRPEGDCYRVIGVAENVHRAGYREPPSMQFYVPFSQDLGFGGAAMVVRPRPGVRDLPSHLQATLVGVAPGVELVSARTLGSYLEAEVRPWQMGTIALGLSALLATLVAIMGVYGVLSYLVAQRRREIGVRIALGASTGAIRTLVLRSGMGAALAGIVLGALLVIPASPWLRPLLYQTTLDDPLVLGTVAAIMTAVALAACLVPARQASRIAPATCLRNE